MAEVFVLLPANSNDESAEVLLWRVKNFSFVEKGTDLVDLSFSKVVETLVAPVSGYLRILQPENNVVRVGEPLFAMAPGAEELKEIVLPCKVSGELSRGPRSPLRWGQISFSLEEGELAVVQSAAAGIPFIDARRWQVLFLKSQVPSVVITREGPRFVCTIYFSDPGMPNQILEKLR